VVAVVVVVGDNDGGCGGDVRRDMAVVTGLGGLISGAVGARVSLQACEAALQVLGGSVDIPASFSRRGRSSLGAICITASTAVDVVVWVLESVVTRVAGSICTPLSILIFAFFISHALHSAVLPFSYASLLVTSCASFPSSSPASWPSLQPFSYACCFAFSTVSSCSFLPTFFPSSRALVFAFSRSSTMTFRSELLQMMAVDVTVVGLQKRPISVKVLRV
jgi:hypothetical protein